MAVPKSVLTVLLYNISTEY